MPPGLSGSPPSFSRRAYYNRPSCNHQPSLSLSLPLSEHSTSTSRPIRIPWRTIPPLLSSIKQINAPSGFFSSFSRDVGGVVPFCGKEGRKEVEGRFSLLMDWKRSREEIGGSGFWWEPRLLRYWILVVFCRVENGWDWIWAGLCWGWCVACVCVCACIYVI